MSEDKRYLIVIHPAKRTVMVNHDAEKQPELKTLQELVGGPIEVVPTYLETSWARENVDRIVLVVNEESRLRGMPHNPAASELTPALPDIVGTAVLLVTKGEEMLGFEKYAAQDVVKEWRL